MLLTRFVCVLALVVVHTAAEWHIFSTAQSGTIGSPLPSKPPLNLSAFRRDALMRLHATPLPAAHLALLFPATQMAKIFLNFLAIAVRIRLY